MADDQTLLAYAFLRKQKTIRYAGAEGFKREGRGVVVFDHPDAADDFWTIAAIYETAKSLRCPDDQRKRITSFIEHYDPAKEIVVAAILPDKRWIIGQFEI